MPNIKVAIVTFLNTNASQRYVYQTINWKQGGVDVSAGLKIGGLVASIRTGPVAGSGLMFPFGKVNMYGPISGFYELKIPTFAALQQMFGGALPTQSTISIDAWLRSTSFNPLSLTFTHQTSINGIV